MMRGLWLGVLAAFFVYAPAHAQLSSAQKPASQVLGRDLLQAPLEDVTRESQDATFFWYLNDARRQLEADTRCGQYRTAAIESRDDLKALNKIETKTRANYNAKAAAAKKANTQALQDYEACYSRGLPDFPVLKARKVLSYTALGQSYAALLPRFDGIDIMAYVTRLDEIARMRRETGAQSGNEALSQAGEDGGTDDTSLPPGVVARLTFTNRQVQVRPATSSNDTDWRSVETGYLLRLEDEVRTGRSGRARLEFADRFDKENAGPTVVNIGSSSQVKIESFIARFNEARAQSVISVVRGTLRAISRSVMRGGRSSHNLRVRTGTSLCGIRGTEIAISYDPEAETARYVLDHGSAYFQLNGGAETPIQPRTAVALRNGRVESTVRISDAEWERIASDTSPAFGLGGEVFVPKEPDVLFQQPPMTGINETYVDPVSRAAQSAAAATRNLLTALKAAIPEDVYRYTAGRYHEQLNARKTQTGNLRSYLQATQQRPLEYTIGCSVCKSRGPDRQCLTWADLTSVASPVTPQRIVFISDQIGLSTRVVNSSVWNDIIASQFENIRPIYCE